MKLPSFLTENSFRIGRPTDYRPEYCEELMRWCAQGKSFATFGARIGVARETLYEWAKKHPEFNNAKKRASDISRAFWEHIMTAGSVGQIKGYKEATPIFITKARFGLRENGEPEEQDSEDIQVKWKGK